MLFGNLGYQAFTMVFEHRLLYDGREALMSIIPKQGTRIRQVIKQVFKCSWHCLLYFEGLYGLLFA